MPTGPPDQPPPVEADFRPSHDAITAELLAYRPLGNDGPELDVDIVLHGSATDGTAGPGAAWAQTCRPGDASPLYFAHAEPAIGTILGALMPERFVSIVKKQSQAMRTRSRPSTA